MVSSFLVGILLFVPPADVGNRDDGQKAIAQAMQATRAAIPEAEKDPERPAFHFHAPAQWMNDPNGPIKVGGWYHLFYQFNPFGDRWGNMHWGHARSKNLVDWEHLPIALWPSKNQKEDAIFSGSSYRPAMDEGASPSAFYTSISDSRPPEQWMAKPLDTNLVRWTKSVANPVLSPSTSGKVSIKEWRDPFLFAYRGEDYLITGGGIGKHGVVALYRAANSQLTSWEYVGVLFTHPDADVTNIECPNIARFREKWALLVSVHGRVESFVGALDPDMRLKWSNRDVLNPGSYASQILSPPTGLPIHLAWVPTDDRYGWNGFLTLPSKLNLTADGTLLRNPISELQSLRTGEHHFHNLEVKGLLDLSSRASGDLLEIVATVKLSKVGSFGVKLRASSNGDRGAEVRFTPDGRLLAPDSHQTTDRQDGLLKLHLFLDRSVIDAYTQDGRFTATRVFHARPEDRGLSFSTEGGAATLQDLHIYTLRPANFDLSRFK